MPITVRRFVAADTARCVEIYEAGWNTALPHARRQITETAFARETEGEALWVAERAGLVIGFVSLWMEDAFVHHLYVHPTLHGRGVGRLLLQQADDATSVSSLSLKCQQRNAVALRFYRRHGFAETALLGRDEFGDWVELRQTRPMS